jgi:hypothetical protein
LGEGKQDHFDKFGMPVQFLDHSQIWATASFCPFDAVWHGQFVTTGWLNRELLVTVGLGVSRKVFTKYRYQHLQKRVGRNRNETGCYFKYLLKKFFVRTKDNLYLVSLEEMKKLAN